MIVNFNFLFDSITGKSGDHRVDLSGDGILKNGWYSGFDDFLDLADDQIIKCFTFDFYICVEVFDIYTLYLHIETQRFSTCWSVEHYRCVDLDLTHFYHQCT